MISALSVIAIFGITVFLSGALSAFFILLVISMHKTSRGPLSESHGDHAGAMSRRMLAGARADRATLIAAMSAGGDHDDA
jgi:hypothetical protein